MPVFVYKAADQRGQTIDGVMEATDARSVVERLQRDALFPHPGRPAAGAFGSGGAGPRRLGPAGNTGA